MKRLLPHIIAVFFLLFLAGTKLCAPTAFAGNSDTSTESIHTILSLQSKHESTYKSSKEFSKDYAFTSIETDNSDVQSQDTLILVATLAKAVVCAICLHFLFFSIKRRHTLYVAFIQLFRYKYLVFGSLRI